MLCVPRRAHYELFTRALDAPNVRPDSVCLVHPTCGPTQVRVCLLRSSTCACTPALHHIYEVLQLSC